MATGEAMFRRSLPGGGTIYTLRQLQRFVEFIRMRHRVRSLLSTIDLFEELNWIGHDPLYGRVQFSSYNMR